MLYYSTFERVLNVGTPFSNLYTALDTPFFFIFCMMCACASSD